MNPLHAKGALILAEGALDVIGQTYITSALPPQAAFALARKFAASIEMELALRAVLGGHVNALEAASAALAKAAPK